MTRKKINILNHFLTNCPHGLAITSSWLKAQGVSPKLAWWYVRSGWLERIGEKAYKKAGDHVSWVGALSALQHQLNLPIHVAGKTALQLLGKAHYVPLEGIKKVTLFVQTNTRLPRWFCNQTNWPVEFDIHKTSLFQKADMSLGLVERILEGIDVSLSAPERAALELLYLVPNQQSFEEAAQLIENLVELRPQVVQSLLEKCSSIKVKRLFLVLSEKFQHPWLSELNLEKINFGYGKRVIGLGGEYHSKYQISVPKMNEG